MLECWNIAKPSKPSKLSKLSMAIVYLTREFDHSPEVIFRALTTPEFIMQWFGPPNTRTSKAIVDLRPGGRYVFELAPISDQGASFTIEGEYQETNAPMVLSFTLNYVGLPNPVGESVVSIRLKLVLTRRTASFTFTMTCCRTFTKEAWAWLASSCRRRNWLSADRFPKG